ncbi:MAG: acylphosphatase, partial [Acidimicrobiales bacterium]
RAEAARLGVSGWVRNRPDGRVEAELEGPPPAVAALLAWLGEGPPRAVVTGLDVEELTPTGASGFTVRRSPG